MKVTAHKGPSVQPSGARSVAYRSLGVGDWWQAIVTAERMDGTLDLEFANGTRLTKIRTHAGAKSECPRGEVWLGADQSAADQQDADEKR